MSSVIVKTKYFIPQSETPYVKRDKIENRLNESRNKELIIIKAPAGFGKSTLTGEYCKRNSGQWISLSLDDNNITKFWFNIFYSLEKYLENLSDFKSEVLNSDNTSIKNILLKFINEFYELLLENRDDPFTIVLDDFHYINDINIQNSLVYFINNLHCGIQFVISTRKAVDFNLSKLRIKNKVHEFDFKNLQFTLDETKEFLNNIINIDLTSHDIENIYQKTEGWIASIQLAALSWGSNDYSSNLAHELSDKNSYLLDYLIDEVLDNMDSSQKDFLIKTSFLPMLNTELCNETLEYKNSYSQLKDLNSTNMFIYRLDNSSTWFRYHHLFKELLYNKFNTEIDNRKNYFIRAFNWFKKNNYIEEAYNILNEINELPLIVDFLEDVALDYMGEGNNTIVMYWLDNLPEEVISINPKLAMVYAFNLIVTSDPNEESNNINYWLNKAQTCAELILEVDKKNELIGQIYTIKAYYYHVSYNRDFDYQKTIDLSLKGNKLLPSNRQSFIALNHQNLFCAYSAELKMNKAREEVIEALNKGKLGKYSYVTISSDYYLSYYYYIIGDIFQAEKEVNRSIEYWINKLGESSPPIGLLYLQKANILISKLKFKEAEDFLLLAKKLIIHTGRKIAISLVHWGLFHIYNYYKNKTNATEEINQFNNFWPGNKNVNQFMSDRLNDTQILELNFDLIPGADFANFPNWKVLIYSLNKEVSMNNENALIILNKWIEFHKETGIKGRIMELNLIKAIHLYNNDNKTESIQIVKEVIEHSKQSENLIILAKTELIPIFKILIKDNFNEALLHRVLEFTAYKKTKNNPYDLTEREIEVIELMSQGKTNKEIGEELHLSPNTIRTHTVNIYDKFGLRSRMEVVKEYQEVY